MIRSLLLLSALLLAQSASAQSRSDLIVAISLRNELITFACETPQTILSRKALTGLAAGRRIVGIDVRPANRTLYALDSALQLYTVDVASAALTPVGQATSLAVKGDAFGVDFNPVVDRLRVVTEAGVNFRIHPETGAVVDANPDMSGLQIDVPLAFDEEDVNAFVSPRVSAAAYTNGGTAKKVTTNYAIESRTGSLVTLGRRERLSPAFAPATPNTGKLFTIGALGVVPDGTVSFDIVIGADSSIEGGIAYASFIPLGTQQTQLYRINLSNGRATSQGVIGRGEPVSGLAVLPKP
jgi:hypothetical protein